MMEPDGGMRPQIDRKPTPGGPILDGGGPHIPIEPDGG